MLLYSLLSSFIDTLVFPVVKTHPSTPKSPDLKYNSTHPYLYIPHPTPRAICLYFHGNAETIDECDPYLQQLSKHLRISIIAPELPGYGRASGSPSHKAAVEVAKKFFALASGTESGVEFTSSSITGSSPPPPHPPQPQQKLPLIVIGRSIGTGSASYIASTNPSSISALILISPFTSISDLACLHFHSAASFVLKGNHFDNLRELKKYHGSLLLQHGKLDDIIPFEHSQRLVEALRKVRVGGSVDGKKEPVELAEFERSGHNDIDFGDMVMGMDRFLTKLGIN
ncbi:hypothetical protein HK097_001561 [Rhizophlyctis rosea]|uniref:Serine aminopeptidase S33 domain-containing protein n=1 Tax=Rhizophlyctis rosea TaxID=64517 RepID=A0AAD5S496_9FUNG|nr:hypothetical protein HK097_001561 [Rhizophlyctis rosea]